ncbi:MAG: hypothetical protein AAF968_21970 [Pseudomonadota bacterium]
MTTTRRTKYGAGILLLAFALGACATPESSQRAIDNFRTTRVNPSG